MASYSHLLFLLFYELLLALHPQVVEIVGISVELQAILVVLTIGSELVEVRRGLTPPAK